MGPLWSLGWGRSTNGELGPGVPSDALSPVSVGGSTGVAGLGVGFVTVCALRTAGSVSGWGANEFGQLGNGEFSGTNVPVELVEP